MTRPPLPAALAALFAAVLASSCSSAPSAGKREASTGIPDSALGLEKSAVTGVPAPRSYEYSAKDPGDGKVLPRPFASAPPLVPHSVDAFLPITGTDNGCLTCHATGGAGSKAGDPVPVPASHYLDLRNAPSVKRAEIAGSRYVCTACHVPQTDAKPLVSNRFQP